MLASTRGPPVGRQARAVAAVQVAILREGEEVAGQGGEVGAVMNAGHEPGHQFGARATLSASIGTK
jgi:hypothetical protein